MYIKESVKVGDKELSIETGKMAKQADGAVVVRYGDTMVLVTAVANDSPREGIDFLPLTVEYTEKTAAAGKIPGGYFKREGRPTEKEILTCRLIDRPSRPLFPKTWRNESQIIGTVLSYDKENPSDVLAMTGAATALHISDIPWAGPYAAVRVARAAPPRATSSSSIRPSRRPRPPTSTSSSPPPATPSPWSRAAPVSSPKTS